MRDVFEATGNEIPENSLEVTLPRLKVLAILEENAAGHLSAEDVYQMLKGQGEDVGLATVYRVLTQFESAGLVRRHNFDSGHSVFELESDDHHDHMVCLQTEKVIEFHNEEIEKLQQKIADEHGYELIDHSLVLYVKPKSE